MVCTGCTKADFDGFDPLTSTLKWIITNDKNDKKSSD